MRRVLAALTLTLALALALVAARAEAASVLFRGVETNAGWGPAKGVPPKASRSFADSPAIIEDRFNRNTTPLTGNGWITFNASAYTACAVASYKATKSGGGSCLAYYRIPAGTRTNQFVEAQIGTPAAGVAIGQAIYLGVRSISGDTYDSCYGLGWAAGTTTLKWYFYKFKNGAPTTIEITTAVATASQWLRLERAGDTLTAYSADGPMGPWVWRAETMVSSFSGGKLPDGAHGDNGDTGVGSWGQFGGMPLDDFRTGAR